MSFETGNSGAVLRDAVIKIGPEAVQEGAYLQLLGKDICPEVYGFIPNGFVMEKLDKPTQRAGLLNSITKMLQDHVWTRPAIPVGNDTNWVDQLRKFGVETPVWAIEGTPCMVHGDPTVSNCLQRKDQLVLCDPRPPRDFVPQFAETDMGVILQSYFGWENVAYGAHSTLWYDTPDFMNHEDTRRKALFWLRAKVARIEHYERMGKNRESIHLWCSWVKRKTNVQ